MGLDLVELVMELEETFNFHIADEGAGSVRTVGDLYRLCLSGLQGKTSERCVSSAAFYQLRRSLAALVGVERRRVQLDAPLGGLLPAPGRRAAWRQIKETTGLRLPLLELPRGVQRCLLAASGVLTLVTVLAIGLWPARAFRPAFGAVSGLLTMAGIFLVFLYAGFRLTRPCAVEIPECCRTIRSAVKTLVNMNYGGFADRVGSFDEAEVWRIVRDRVVRVTGVPPERVTEDAQLVKDLGLD